MNGAERKLLEAVAQAVNRTLENGYIHGTVREDHWLSVADALSEYRSSLAADERGELPAAAGKDGDRG